MENTALAPARTTNVDGSRIVVVIPAYREAATIADIVRSCRAVLPAETGPVEVIVVDDGSPDDTGPAAAQAGALVLRNPRNSGKGASLARGLAQAAADGAEYLITLDGDGQHRPEDLPRLLACAAADRIVIGSRRAGGHAAPRGRRIANRIADFWVSWAAGSPIEDSQSGLRVYPAALAQRLGPTRTTGFAWESEVLITAGRLGFHTVSVPVPAIYGAALSRSSHFRPIADITRIVVMVAGRLLRRGMYPVGLWRALRGRRSGAPPLF